MWLALLRISTVLSVGLTVKQLIDEFTNDIKANRIYSTSQVSRFFGMSRKEVIGLVKKKEIKAKMVDGNYRITGENILEYLNKK